jgi:peptidyl-prolyl cis-trans isomerase C
MLPYPEQASRAALVLAALAALALSSPAYAQTTPAPAAPAAPAASVADPVVAVVNGSEIHRSDVETAREDLPQQYQSYPFEIVYPALLERLVDGKLLVAAGRAQGLATDPEVKARLVRLEDQVIQTVYLTRAVKAKLTDAVLKQHYEEYVKANPPEPEVHARHILTKTEDEAKEAIKELKAGADFAELAKKNSSGPSAAKGGDLGFIKRGDVVAEFADAAFALKPGQYTETPVKTQFGWHVIKVEAARQSSPPSFEEAKEEVEREASREMIQGIVADLRGKAKIARFNPDGSPKTEGDDKDKKGSAEPKKD